MNKTMKFWEIKIEIDSIIIGERVKGGVFRPCLDTIPASTIEGALRHYFGSSVPAVGFFEEGSYEFDEFTYSVTDKSLLTSKLPLFSEYLKPKSIGKIKAKIFIPKENNISSPKKSSVFYMGALKTKGFGRTEIREIKEIGTEIKQGILKVRLYEEEKDKFRVTVISPVYGYLFKPDAYAIGGVYKRALFEGSLVRAPEVFLKEVAFYDE